MVAGEINCEDDRVIVIPFIDFIVNHIQERMNIALIFGETR